MRSLMSLLTFCLLLIATTVNGWGFYGHRKINELAVFLLPPEMMPLYKEHIGFLSEHAVDPDKRRYAVNGEAPKHYIDIDHYGKYPYTELPRNWSEAVAKFGEDTLMEFGIVPWWVPNMKVQLTNAFRQKHQANILRLSAEIGHYIADAHVPLHATMNHNGQLSGQTGIHAFWESRIPELFAERDYDFIIGKAGYIEKPSEFIWNRVLESAAAADSVLKYEALLSREFDSDKKFSFDERLGRVTRQYSAEFSAAYQQGLNNMIERRMRQSIFAVASFWYTAWVDAGQPDLRKLQSKEFTAAELREFEEMNRLWQAGAAKGKICE